MIILILLSAQFLNIYFAHHLTKKKFSYLVICNVILLLNLIGSLINESEEYHSYQASLYLVAFSLLMNIGAKINNIFTSTKLNVCMEYKICSENNWKLENEISTKIILIAFISFFTITLYFYSRYGIPLFFEDLNYARTVVQKEAHIYYRFFLYFMPISSALLYTKYKIFNNDKDRNLFFISFAITALVLLSLGYKGYVIWYIAFLIMLMNIYSDRIFKYAIILGLVGIISGVVATTYMYSSNLIDSFDLLLRRATRVSAYGYNVAFYELYPQLSNVKIGNSALNQFLAEWKFGSNNKMAEYSMGITTTIAGALLIYLGKAGALLSAPLIGFIMQQVYFLNFKYKVSPLLSVFYLYLSYTFVGVVNRGTIQNVFILPVLSLFLLAALYIATDATLKGTGRYRFNKIHT